MMTEPPTPRGKNAGGPKRQAIEEAALSHFAFLVQEKGFRKAKTDRIAAFTTFHYLHERIGLVVYIEYYDPMVSVSVIRAENRRFLLNWDTSAVKRRWNRSVDWVWSQLQMVSSQQLYELDTLLRGLDPTDTARYERLFALYETLLRETIDKLTTLPDEVLFPPPTSGTTAQ
jgi:hypothetical protein